MKLPVQIQSLKKQKAEFKDLRSVMNILRSLNNGGTYTLTILVFNRREAGFYLFGSIDNFVIYYVSDGFFKNVCKDFEKKINGFKCKGEGVYQLGDNGFVYYDFFEDDYNAYGRLDRRLGKIWLFFVLNDQVQNRIKALDDSGYLWAFPYKDKKYVVYSFDEPYTLIWSLKRFFGLASLSLKQRLDFDDFGGDMILGEVEPDSDYNIKEFKVRFGRFKRFYSRVSESLRATSGGLGVYGYSAYDFFGTTFHYGFPMIIYYEEKR